MISMINRLKSTERICCVDFGIEYIEDNEKALKYYITHSFDDLFILRAFLLNDVMMPLELLLKHGNLKLILRLSSKFNIFITAEGSSVFGLFSRFDYSLGKKINQLNDNIPFTFFKRDIIMAYCYRKYDLELIKGIAKDIGYDLDWRSEKYILSNLIYEKSPFVGMVAKVIGWEAVMSMSEAYKALSSLSKKELLDIGFKTELFTPSPISNSSFEDTIKKVNYANEKMVNGMY